MHDHQRLSSDVSETEKPQNHKELTPREVEIKKLEESSDGYIKEWKELKKEVGKMTVDFWAFKACFTFCMMFVCCMATKEVSLFIPMKPPLLGNLLVGEFVISLFPFVHFLIRRRQVKAEIKAKNEDIECEGDIGKIVFDSEKEGNEEYLEFYMDQLKKFNDVKSKEVSILEEEIRLLKEKNIRWEITVYTICAITFWICFIHTTLIAFHTGKQEDIRDAKGLVLGTIMITFMFLIRVVPYISCAPCSLFSACCRSIRGYWTRRNRIAHKLQNL
ncbi:hypothetical protein CRE_19405 [Caenorhabditis remanei]|uniref:Uncharacterized protein n=1 Tax=Caenorhabditis remanei TaxID=31234 RepID=E3N576_CAERE|nr:hypothetical protein CRE_19405 [Caenorhabditis remanei]